MPIEPKNIDLVVGPSVFTEETKNRITQAIAQYKKNGQKPAGAHTMVKAHIPVGHAKVKNAQPGRSSKRGAGI